MDMTCPLPVPGVFCSILGSWITSGFNFHFFSSQHMSRWLHVMVQTSLWPFLHPAGASTCWLSVQVSSIWLFVIGAFLPLHLIHPQNWVLLPVVENILRNGFFWNWKACKLVEMNDENNSFDLLTENDHMVLIATAFGPCYIVVVKLSSEVTMLFGWWHNWINLSNFPQEAIWQTTFWVR